MINNGCKVIVTYLAERNRGREGMEWPHHPQINLNSAEDVLDLIKDQITMENTYDAGIPVDLIIINNESGWDPGKVYLNSVNGTKTKNGIIKVIHRENTGFSFAGFSYAFNIFKNDYDYWMFSEDDLFIGGDKYYKKAIDKFNSINNIGFLAFTGVETEGYPIHCHSATGITIKNVLLDVCKNNNGILPCNTTTDGLDGKGYTKMIDSEIEFTNIIARLGYKLRTYGENSWNFKTNLLTHYLDKSYKNDF